MREMMQAGDAGTAVEGAELGQDKLFCWTRLMHALCLKPFEDPPSLFPSPVMELELGVFGVSGNTAEEESRAPSLGNQTLEASGRLHVILRFVSSSQRRVRQRR